MLAFVPRVHNTPPGYAARSIKLPTNSRKDFFFFHSISEYATQPTDQSYQLAALMLKQIIPALFVFLCLLREALVHQQWMFQESQDRFTYHVAHLF